MVSGQITTLGGYAPSVRQMKLDLTKIWPSTR